MPLDPEMLVQSLRESNARLGFWLESLAPQSSSLEVQGASPQQIHGLLSELMRAGEWLRMVSQPCHAALQDEIAQYRRNVERLRDLLPLIHDTLLRERSRLEQERARVQSAAEWARRSHQTL